MLRRRSSRFVLAQMTCLPPAPLSMLAMPAQWAAGGEPLVLYVASNNASTAITSTAAASPAALNTAVASTALVALAEIVGGLASTLSYALKYFALIATM